VRIGQTEAPGRVMEPDRLVAEHAMAVRRTGRDGDDHRIALAPLDHLEHHVLDHRRALVRARGDAPSGRRVARPASRLAPVSAIRLPARCSDIIVPASVHQPSKISHESWLRFTYHMFTSVISSSPRPDGFNVRTTSKT